MLIEVLSVCKKNEQEELSAHEGELKQELSEQGFSLTGVRKTLLQATAIKETLSAVAKASDKPDVAIVTGALRTKDNASFKKYFVESIAASERAENDPVPKDYWKKRNAAVKEARAKGAGKDELAALEKEFELTRKKVKVFSLGDFGNGYKGYAFVYNGVRVAAVPKAELTGKSFAALAAMAARRTTEVFENGKNEFPDGFSVQTYVPPKTGFVNRFVPLPGDGKKEIIRKCVVIASALIFLGALWALFYNMVFLSVQNAQLNGDIQRIAHQTDDGEDGSKPNAPKKGEGSKINWDELKKITRRSTIRCSGTRATTPTINIISTTTTRATTIPTVAFSLTGAAPRDSTAKISCSTAII